MHKNNLHYFYQFSTICFGIVFFYISNTFLPIANGQSVSNDQPNIELPTTTNPTQLLETSILKINDQPTILIRPTFNDDSTNIAFYMKCPSVSCPSDGTYESPVYIFSAENLGHGVLPFSEYWAPPIVGDYVAIEYKNDKQQFSCSGISFDNCLTDPHFINVFYFALVNNATTITPEMLAEKTKLNNPSQILETDNSTTSEALLLLSIRLSSTSISSNLDNGLIVTATLDGIASIATSSITDTSTSSTSTDTNISTSTDIDEGSTVGSFIMNIVDSVIEIFTPEEKTTTEPELHDESPTQSEPIQSENIPTESIQSESPIEIPTIEAPTNELTTENAVQSSISTDDLINNEIITTEF